MKSKILIVEDQQSSRELLEGFLEEHGYAVRAVGTAEEALESFKKEGYTCALLDIRLPGMSGIELLKNLREIDPEFIGIFMTAFGSVETAVDGMSAGAYRYIQKPVNLKELLSVIEAASLKWHENREYQMIKENNSKIHRSDIIADSQKMKDILSLVARVAPTDVPVLITGESGTGKEIIANLMHESSLRSAKSYIELNCAALPENLVEAELFGYEPGAFTGANHRKRGMAELADKGTLFLDEIGEFPLNLQAKLLRMIDGNGFFRVGGSEVIKPDLRIIAATNRNLEEMYREKLFREDLFFRLKGIEIKLPPLRERPEDILSLCRMFIDIYSKKYKREVDGLSPAARDTVLRYPWTGNIRELKHTIESAVILTRTSLLTVDDLRINHCAGADHDEKSCDLEKMTLAEVEKNHIMMVMAIHDGNVSKASKALGIHRNTLSQKIREYNLSSD